MTKLDSNTQYRLGEPDQYGSVYGYMKQRYPVLDQNDVMVGYIKKEAVLDVEGNVSSWAYYTRDFERPKGALRFYTSPEALLKAFGFFEASPVLRPVVDKPNLTDDEIRDAEMAARIEALETSCAGLHSSAARLSFQVENIEARLSPMPPAPALHTALRDVEAFVVAKGRPKRAAPKKTITPKKPPRKATKKTPAKMAMRRDDERGPPMGRPQRVTAPKKPKAKRPKARA